MLMAQLLISPPTLLAAITGVLIASCLLSITPRGIVLYKKKLHRLESLGFDRAIVVFCLMVFMVGSAAIIMYLAINKTQPVIATALVILAYYSMGWLLAILIQQRERTLRNQLADLGVVMSGAVRANLTPALAFEHAVTESSRPLSKLMSRVMEDYHRGVPLKSTLSAVSTRLDLDAFMLFTTAVGVTLERGGRLDEALDRISESIRDQCRLENKLDALTASGRNALVMLALFPFGFAAFFYHLDPSGYDVIFSTPWGQLVIVTSLAIVFLSVRWGKAILDKVGA